MPCAIRPPVFESFFAPCRDLQQWIIETFLQEDSPAYNPEHEHLLQAHIGFLWANVPNASKGNQVLGMAEIFQPMGHKWARSRQEEQMAAWFGATPDFVITLDAEYCRNCSDVELMALIEHELYHCAQAVDEFGAPRFNRGTGLPIFRIKGHDVEEFVAVVERYGTGAQDSRLSRLVEAANRGPTIGHAAIAKCCGTCKN